MDTIVSFIQSNPGISFLNLQLFFGAEINAGKITEEQIKAECGRLHPDGSVQLGYPEVEDYVVNIPLSVFDGDVSEITPEYVKELCDKILLLEKPIDIVLNEQVPNYEDYLGTRVEDFKIDELTTAYDHIKSNKDTVSKIREMLSDFQPMFLERKSHSILKQMTIKGVPIFRSISDFIKAFTDPTFFGFYDAVVGQKPALSQMTPAHDVWTGSFGLIRLTIHVMGGRQGTGAGNKINTGNVIQSALLYKDRKNDFIRSNSALTMIKYCSTQWPDGSRSIKNGTDYTFSDLYTGEKIIQKYDGKQPDYAAPESFASILETYHVPFPKKIHTNQEHIFAVYPASCVFRDDCYYETLVDNLQMISQKANSDVNSKEYESPFGKLQYVHDIHEKQNRELVGRMYLTQLQLCSKAIQSTASDELHDEFRQLMQRVADKETELEILRYQTAQECTNVDARLKTPLTESDKTDLLKKRTILMSTIDTIEMNLSQLIQAKSMTIPTSKSLNPGYESTKKMFMDLKDEKEYHTRKALLMGRLMKLQDCCLDLTTADGKETAKHRRDIVLSCIDSVSIIIACAKISVLTVTTPETVHNKLVKDSRELNYLRSLSMKLFHEYNSTKAKQTEAADQIISFIHSKQDLMEAIEKQIVLSAVTTNDFHLSEATRLRQAIDNSILNEMMALLLAERIKVPEIEETKYRLTEKHIDQINFYDEEIKKYTKLQNDLNGEFSYILTHLYETGQYISTNLFEIANTVNHKTLQLLNLLGNDKTPEFQECMKLLTRPESRYAPVSCGMVDIENREDVFDDVGIGRTVGLVSEICPQEEGINTAVANEIAVDILNGQPAADTVDNEIDEAWLLMQKRAGDKINKRTRLSIDLKKMISGLEVDQIRAKIAYRTALLKRKDVVEGDASSSPQFSRWMGRLNNNDARKTKAAAQKLTTEAEGIRSFMYFYVCNNPQLTPKEPTIRQLTAYLNNDANTRERETHLSRLVTLLQQSSPSGPKRAAMGGGGLTGDIEEMNQAIEENDVVKMYDLYMEHFDKETDSILFYQVYSILSKQSIYVPLYRRDVIPLEELIDPVRLKRLDYTGDLHDFDCVYADNFCVQIFGKNVCELLDDLAKGKLTVPRGVFPNICDNPFNPYSLICILEVCRFFCLFLPFAGRLHFYFAGVLSFMNQTYDANMVSIQTDEILSYLKHPDFFQCFHAAAEMYEGYESVPAPEVPVEPEPPEPPGPDLEPPPAPLAEVDPTSVSDPIYKLENERRAKSGSPLADYGGTRRYRRYKQKTKRHTLNKRFKRNRTRRLH